MDIVGKMGCMACGEDVLVKRSPKNHHLTVTCSWQKGGCGSQFFSRTADCDELIIKRLKKVETEQTEPSAAAKEAPQMPQPKVNGGMFGGFGL